MFNSIVENRPAAQFDEVVPRSSLARVGLGFVFAAAFFVAEFALFLPGVDEESFNFGFTLIMLSGWTYWLFCVHRFHKLLAELSSNQYPITPGEAVGRHFIPFYNFLWLFRWPSSLSDYVNERGRVRMASGKLIGLVFLGAFVLRFLDGAIGLACMFGGGMYVAAKLRQHIASVRGITADMLPPQPNKDLFGYAPTEDQTNSVDSPDSVRLV